MRNVSLKVMDFEAALEIGIEVRNGKPARSCLQV